MEAKVTWQGNMAFTGTADSGFNILLDAEEKVGGHNTGFRPLELMAMSLAGCTAMDVISILQKKRQDIIRFEVRVDADRADDHPRDFTQMRVEYILTGRGINAKAVERAIELSETKYCPAQSMLGKVVPIKHTYTIHEVS